MLLSSFRKPKPSPETARENALVELIFAGNSLVSQLVYPDDCDFICVCGPIMAPYENTSHHRNFCPVARFYAAVEVARKAAL